MSGRLALPQENTQNEKTAAYDADRGGRFGRGAGNFTLPRGSKGVPPELVRRHGKCVDALCQDAVVQRSGPGHPIDAADRLPSAVLPLHVVCGVKEQPGRMQIVEDVDGHCIVRPRRDAAAVVVSREEYSLPENGRRHPVDGGASWRRAAYTGVGVADPRSRRPNAMRSDGDVAGGAVVALINKVAADECDRGCAGCQSQH